MIQLKDKSADVAVGERCEKVRDIVTLVDALGRSRECVRRGEVKEGQLG